MANPFLTTIGEYLDGRIEYDLLVEGFYLVDQLLVRFSAQDPKVQKELLDELKRITAQLQKIDPGPDNSYLKAKIDSLNHLIKQLSAHLN